MQARTRRIPLEKGRPSSYVLEGVKGDEVYHFVPNGQQAEIIMMVGGERTMDRGPFSEMYRDFLAMVA